MTVADAVLLPGLQPDHGRAELGLGLGRAQGDGHAQGELASGVVEVVLVRVVGEQHEIDRLDGRDRQRRARAVLTSGVPGARVGARRVEGRIEKDAQPGIFEQARWDRRCR